MRAPQTFTPFNHSYLGSEIEGVKESGGSLNQMKLLVLSTTHTSVIMKRVLDVNSNMNPNSLKSGKH